MKVLKKIPKKALFFLVFLLTISSYKNELFEVVKQLEIYNSIFKEINVNYVKKTEPVKLMESGVKSMLSNLDPYTVYYNEQNIQNSRLVQSSGFGNIGARLKFINNSLYVVEIIENLAADKAGLKAGDIITKISGVDVSNVNESIESLLIGDKNSKVSLNYIRENKILSATLVRKNKKTVAVPYYKITPSGIGYICLSKFSKGAAREVESALKFLLIDNPKGIILDLKSNPGGLLNEAVDIVNLFIPKNTLVVSTRGNNENYNFLYKTKNDPVNSNIPLVVVINDQSASASEIVAGAIQDLDRGIIVGKRSYGKGLVQEIKNLPYGSKLKITVSKYYTPSGRCIQTDKINANRLFKTKKGRKVYEGNGISPDIMVGKIDKFNLIQSLKNKNLFFLFVAKFNKNQIIQNIENYNISSKTFESFKSFCFSEDFKINSKTETLINKINTASKEEEFILVLNKLEKFNQIINKEKESLFELLKVDIIEQLEEEFIKFNFYKKDLIKFSIKNNNSIIESSQVLLDIKRYNSILKK